MNGREHTRLGHTVVCLQNRSEPESYPLEVQTNMADLNRMDRTWLCSVLFMDIVQYSSQSVEVQMKWKRRFNGYLMEAIQAVPENEPPVLVKSSRSQLAFDLDITTFDLAKGVFSNLVNMPVDDLNE